MKHRTQIILLTLLFLACNGFAQEKYEMSKPVDFRKAGVFKVLCMKNGNTMLFHFENNKPITVKIFDSSRKEIASKEHLCKVLDILLLEDVEIKGLFEINGEAVMFFDQDRYSKHGLVRLRFDSRNGALIEERLIGQSKGENKRMRFYVMQHKNEDKYSVLFSTDKNHPKECDLFVVTFNNKHESVRETQLELARKKYDYLDVIGASYTGNGIMVTLGLSTLRMNGTISHSGGGYDPNSNVVNSSQLAGNSTASNSSRYDPTNSSFGPNMFPVNNNLNSNNDELDPTGNVSDHFLAIYYIPNDSSGVRTKMADVSTEVYPYHVFCTRNSFAGSINLLLQGYRDAYIKSGLEMFPAAILHQVLLKMDENDLGIKFKWINNVEANTYLRQRTDTNHFFTGLPLAIFTNENGLSTMVSESFVRYKNVESSARPNVYETYLGNICVTQFDDDGNEIWGTVLPKTQYYKSYRHYYYIRQQSNRWNEQVLIGDLPPQVYDRQFVSANVYTRDKNFFIIYNDAGKNFGNSLEKPGDTVYTFDNTNLCYYKINRKKEITKNYVFGNPEAREYKCGFVEGACFDEQRGVYAALVQYTRGSNVSLRMAWRKLD
jgi:hypothetical protein